MATTNQINKFDTNQFKNDNSEADEHLNKVQLNEPTQLLNKLQLKQTKTKWQKIIDENKQQEDTTPFLLKEESFQNSNKFQQFNHQKNMMQQACKHGKQLLISKNYQQAAKQLSKTLMAFQFIAKNHVQTVGKQQIKNIMIKTVLPSYNNLSLCYLKLKNYQLVISFTNQVLAQDSDNVKARYRRALAYKQIKRTDEAIKDFQIIKKLDIEIQNDCIQLIKQCKTIQMQQKKKRKQAAQRFISGYKRQDNQTVNNDSNKSQPSKKISSLIQYPKQSLNTNITTWIKQRCAKCSQIIKKLFRKQQQKKNN